MSTLEDASTCACSDDDDDDDNDHDPLEVLIQELGVKRGEAVDALLQCGGDVDKAREQLLPSTLSSNVSNVKPNNNKGSICKKWGKAKSHKDGSNNNYDEAASQQQQGHGGGNKKKGFKEQRKQELQFQKALRDQRCVCRICGGPHERKVCPGIVNDGHGHSRHQDA